MSCSIEPLFSAFPSTSWLSLFCIVKRRLWRGLCISNPMLSLSASILHRLGWSCIELIIPELLCPQASPGSRYPEDMSGHPLGEQSMVGFPFQMVPGPRAISYLIITSLSFQTDTMQWNPWAPVHKWQELCTGCTLSFAESRDGTHFSEDCTTKEAVSALKQKEDNHARPPHLAQLKQCTLPAEEAPWRGISP